jgi:heptosyltransferase III
MEESRARGTPGRQPSSLLYHAGALGDFITALPAMHAWRRLHPRERVILLGRRDHAPLAGDPVPFDEAWDAGAAQFAPLFAAGGGAALRGRFSVFTTALLFSGASSPLRDSLAAAGVQGIIRQDPFPADRVHIVDYHLSLFPPASREPGDAFPRVRTTAEPLEGPPHPVVLHPGSGSRAKNWPHERFAELSARLQGEGRRVVWIVGPAEDGVDVPRGAVCWRSPPLPALAASLRRAALYVGNDSGVTHLAAAAGCPTIALFGASDPAVWSPRGQRVTTITHGEGMQTISVDEALAEAVKLLGETERTA